MPEQIVHIVGTNQLQNELLVSFLEKETGLKCGHATGLDPAFFLKGGVEHDRLLFFDCMAISVKALWSQLGVDFHSPKFNQQIIAFFNVDPDEQIEEEAMLRGVRGIFYVSEALGMLAKGVQAILNGEMWYSRKTMSKCLLETNRNSLVPHDAAVELTHRETEILIEIASGASNSDIAKKLFISPHTVKTHIYNIYKKINISNRLQATLWVAKHL